MCQPTSSRRTHRDSGCNCGCCGCGCGRFIRRFMSAKEEAECLEEYRDQLKKELVAVEERIHESKGK